MLGVQKIEIYPFFHWQLLSHTPGWETRASGLIVHRVQSEPVPGGRHVVPNGDIRDHKVVYATIQACGRRPAACDAEAKECLWPIVTAHQSD